MATRSRSIQTRTKKTSRRLIVREGLPARFRMRHTPHYVDELLGDAPLRTVREIPISEIEAPNDDRADVEELERSIRRLGVIEPLLVGRRGAFYSIIAGMRRLRAAQRAGLATVPCLVHELDETRFADMRAAAAQRLAIPVTPDPQVERAPRRNLRCRFQFRSRLHRSRRSARPHWDSSSSRRCCRR